MVLTLTKTNKAILLLIVCTVLLTLAYERTVRNYVTPDDVRRGRQNHQEATRLGVGDRWGAESEQEFTIDGRRWEETGSSSLQKQGGLSSRSVQAGVIPGQGHSGIQPESQDRAPRTANETSERLFTRAPVAGRRGQEASATATPRAGFVTHGLMGRLGNQLFQFASAFCIARQAELRLVLPDLQDLSLFQNPTLDGEVLVNGSLASSLPSPRHLWESVCCSLDERLLQLKPGDNYVLGGYLQSWRYFEPCKADLRKMLTFREEFVAEAEDIVADLHRTFPAKFLVGVHIRMEDHTAQRAVSAGKHVAQPDYYVRAMAYFRLKLGQDRVVFVVILSQEAREWWRRNVTSAKDVTFLDRSLPAVDMEVLSCLDHLIMSVGTFGWWAGYRSAGTVVYCRDFFRPGSHYASQFLHNATEHFYPGWIGL